MKSLALLIFLFLVVPGSGQLVWDGLPLSTRAEFATLLVLSLAITNQRIRDAVRARIGHAKWRGVLKPAIGLLVLLKLLTFTWYPFSDGFDACYRSVYFPIADSQVCEKSYEGPFLRRSDLGLSNTSRIDRTIDFGTHMHDWSLPFMNEYPRLGALWLNRFPFTAQYGTNLRNKSDSTRFLPIYGNGELAGSIGSESFSTANVALSDRYEFPRVTVLEVPAGVSEFALNYRYSDDDATETPDDMPPVRGPYAMLKVGEPQSRASLMKFLRVRIRGWTVDIARDATPAYVVARDDSGAELGRSEPLSRPDVADFVGKSNLAMSGFNFSIPAAALKRGVVNVEAIYDDRRVTLGKLSQPKELIPDLPVVELVASVGAKSEFTVWYDADRNDFAALAPGARYDRPMSLDLLVVLLDLVNVVLFGGLLLGLLRVWRRELLPAAGFAAAAFGLATLGERIAPNVFGTRLFLPLVTLSLLVVLVVRYLKPLSLVAYLPTAVVLAAYKSFDHLKRFHGSKGERWWGRLLYYWRDSDWYATQGYARTVFLEGSLRGGEAGFWFQAGPRYLAFATRSMLGENDVLVGILMTALGFFAVLVLSVRFLSSRIGRSATVVGSLVLVIGLFFMSDDLMASFGFVGSSEYPTWTALFLITGFITVTRTESRTWLLVGMSLALGYLIQLRPNQIGGVVLIFIALLLLVDRTDSARAAATMSKMTLSFAAVTSFSLLHNLYYAEAFVPFTANAGINYAFSWRDVLGLDTGEATWAIVWDQVRYMMYWNAVENWAWALGFWGSQVAWLFVIAYRTRLRVALRVRSLLLLIPFGYALPMLKYQMGSYYPRHLVAINLSFMCAALMAWPRSDELAEREIGAEPAAEQLRGSDDSTPVATPAPDSSVSAVTR